MLGYQLMCSGRSAAKQSEREVSVRLPADLGLSVTTGGTGGLLAAAVVAKVAGRRWRLAAVVAELGLRTIGRPVGLGTAAVVTGVVGVVAAPC